jgi:hypothetical protein
MHTSVFGDDTDNADMLTLDGDSRDPELDEPARAEPARDAADDDVAGASRPPEPTLDGTGTCSKSRATGLAGFFFPYIYFDRDQVLLDGIDFEATLKIAELELAHGGASSVLTIWAIRDQIIPASIAEKISELYLQYIDGEGLAVREGIFGHDFAVWHFAWAMGNIYRLGTAEVKQVMRDAYEDALTRPDTLNAPYGGILERHLTGDCIYMGDAHDGGRSYAHSHIVIPGNPDYLQSFEDYTPR